MWETNAGRRKRETLLGALGACLFLLLAVFASADYVILKNGKRLNGVIRAESPQWVSIESVGGMLTLDRASVDRVEKQPTGDNFMLSGMLALRKPDFLEAAGLLKRSLDSGADPAQIRKTILEASPYFLDRLAYVSNTEKKEWLALCRDLATSGGAAADSDWTYLRGDMALALGDNGAALDAWRLLDAAYFAGHDKQRDRVVKWALKRLSRAVQEHQLDEGVGVLELLNRLDPERARSCRAILAMQKAADARDRGNVAEACRIYAEDLMPLAPEISKVCLRTVIEPQCELLCQKGAFNEAAALVRQCAKPHLPELASRLLAGIHRSHIKQCLADGRWELARGILAEASEFFDDEELQRLKQECAYAETRSRIAADDSAGHYKLGLELMAKKMNGAAIEEFVLAGRAPELKEMAQKQIALIHEGEALDLMEKIGSRYGEKRYLEVLDLVDEFRRKFPDSELTGKVDALSKQAHQKVGEEARTAESLAMSQLEQARRLYYQGQVGRARELVDGVLAAQPSTSTVALSARTFKQEILKAQLAQGVESGPPAPAKSPTLTTATRTLIPVIDPALLDQLNEDAYKNEIQEILKQLQL